jgi:DNA-directed RNA polymerase subunit RPC12/RpoP
MRKEKAIYIGYNSHDSEAWYQCPHCGRRFGSWSVYHNPKNENGVKEYCPYCQKELEGLE